MSALLTPSPVHLGIFDAAREGSRAPAKVGICEWAEREIRILKGAEKGRLRLARAPYMRGMLESFTDPYVREITLKTASQVAKTTVMIICVAYAMDEAPDDALYVMPGEELAREISIDRIKPMFHASPSIRRQFTEFSEDQQAVRYRFLRSTLFFAWAKSPATLASRPVRYVFLDETGKYPTFSGKEADPVSLATERTKTFSYNKKIFVASTPTVPGAVVSTKFEMSDKRRYWVPCPHCGEKQLLVSQYLKWPPGMRGSDVEAGNLAWYECCKCGAHLTDRDKPRMLAEGEWRAETPNTRHHGYQINTLYSPWVRWSEYAKEFLESHSKPEKLMNFVNSWEGEDWVEKALPVSEESIKSLRVQCDFGVVPSWALMLTFGADVQNDLVKYIVRGWGVGRRSRLIDYGMFPRTKDENGLWRVDKKTGLDDDLQRIEAEILPTQYKREGGGTMGIFRAYIDRGYRTDAVDKLCGRNTHILFGVKGANEVQYDGEGGALVHEREMKPDRKRKFHHYRLNTTHFKDTLQNLRVQSGKIWEIPDTVDETYLREVSAEHKRIDRDSKGRGVHVWVLREGYKDNHYFDGEVYALAAAMHKNQLDKLVEPATQPGMAPQQKPDGNGWYSGW